MSPADAPDLQQLQKLLYRLIVAPNGVEDAIARDRGAIDLDQIIVGDERMTALARAGIYANSYFYRLLETLREDFPVTLAVAGDDEFHNLVTGYLVDYPPSEPSLLYAGRYLADYLGSSPIIARWPFIADLARLERGLIDSFHASDAPSLDRFALQSIPPDTWPVLRFKLHPAARLLKLQWRVDEIVRAFEQKRGQPPVVAEPVMLIVCRKQAQTFYRPAEPLEAVALSLIEQGSDFAAVCEAISAATNDDLPQLINHLLLRWLDDGLLLKT